MRLRLCWGAVCFVASVSVAHAADWSVVLKLEGTATEPDDFAFRLCGAGAGWSCYDEWEPGSPGGAIVGGLPENATALALRDSIVPPRGGSAISGYVGVRRVHLLGNPAIKFDGMSGGSHPLVIFVKRPADPDWINLEINVPVTLSGITFTVLDPDLGLTASGGNVPAVSAWGLLVLAATVASAGTVIATRKNRRGVA